MEEFWKNLAPRARAGLAAGAVLVAAIVVALGYWAYRADYQVLFAELSTADAAAMAAELDRSKTPYQLAEGGTTILVPQEIVYKTRLKLMGQEIPLHGAVGFEVFNNADFGMTDFVQKVNYLRAVQGELTRTILAIDGVAAARVHLAIPEQGMFRKNASRAKASVTVTMKKGQLLAPEQVAGVQRLVAASVPEISVQDVTVLNQHGVALTQSVAAAGAEPGTDTGQAALEAKRSTETYLTKKVAAVLERAFGADAAVASVDVALNLDQSRVTTEEVLPAKGQVSSAPSGVIVRERHVAPDAAEAGAARTPPGGTTESDYQVGRRTEQMVGAAGSIRRMTVAVLVRQPLNEDQVAKLKEVVMLAVGFSETRGDAIVVHSMDQFAQLGAANAPLPAAEPPLPAAPAAPQPRPMAAVLAVGTLVVAGLAAVLWQRRRGQPRRLSAAERLQLTAQIRHWMQEPEVQRREDGA